MQPLQKPPFLSCNISDIVIDRTPFSIYFIIFLKVNSPFSSIFPLFMAQPWLNPWVSHHQALMGACAQPRLARPLAKIAVAALADAAERGANASEVLQQAARGKRGMGTWKALVFWDGFWGPIWDGLMVYDCFLGWFFGGYCWETAEIPEKSLSLTGMLWGMLWGGHDQGLEYKVWIKGHDFLLGRWTSRNHIILGEDMIWQPRCSGDILKIHGDSRWFKQLFNSNRITGYHVGLWMEHDGTYGILGMVWEMM